MARTNGGGLQALIALAAAMAAIVIFVTLGPNDDNNTGASPPPTAQSPVPSSSSNVGEPAPTGEPSASATAVTPGQVLWKGTLTFIAQPFGGDNWSVAARPPTDQLNDATLILCASSCQPPNITSQALVAWTGKKPPTHDECAAKLAGLDGSTGFIPLQPGRMGCFQASGGIGFITVLTSSPSVTASGTVWAY